MKSRSFEKVVAGQSWGGGKITILVHFRSVKSDKFSRPSSSTPPKIRRLVEPSGRARTLVRRIFLVIFGAATPSYVEAKNRRFRLEGWVFPQPEAKKIRIFYKIRSFFRKKNFRFFPTRGKFFKDFLQNSVFFSKKN